METIASAWQRISAWYAANTPPQTFLLAPGANEAEIAHFESEVGFRLPEDLRASFALHNGTLNNAFLLHFGELLSLEQILQLHSSYRNWQSEENWGLEPDYKAKNIQGPIKPIWWSPLRFPLTDNSGDAAMADFDPAEGGKLGQIIEFSHETGPLQVLAPSFGQWLNDLADGLENGDYIYFEDEETVGPPGSW
ncbi:glucan biosynthesis protein [bacterium]|nr:MAG: glucan biosynthesis protein [bacterium]